MTAEDYKAIIRHWVEEGWNKGNLNLADELYSPEYEIHDPTTPGPVKGIEGFKGYVSTLRTALPDIHFTVEDLVADGDKVAWRFTARGTQTGDLMGVPPTNKPATVMGIVVSRFSGGKWAEDYVSWDTLGMLQQMGVIPS